MKISHAIIIMSIISCAFIYESRAVDFSQTDKQSHFLLGCASSEIARGIAVDAGSDNAGWWGLGTGILVGFAYEAQQSHGDKQDAYATAIGSAVCIGTSETIKLMVSPHSISVKKEF